VTLLFTDIDHSTELVKKLQGQYGDSLAVHRELLRAAFAEHHGAEIDTQGDAFFVAFAHAADAVAAAVAAQRALNAHPWPERTPITVRMGLHTGEPHPAQHGYTGIAVHRAARTCTLGHGGQVLLSRSTAGIFDDAEIDGVAMRDLGEQRLKDFERPERVFQLVISGLAGDFPPLRTAGQIPLSGTVTIVGVEGRRMMRLVRELPSDQFGALLNEYQRVVPHALEQAGGRQVDVAGDSVSAAFAGARNAAFAAIAVQKTVSAHDWPYGLKPEVSVGLHSGEAGIGWLGPAAVRCAELCDAAEGGQIFLSWATAGLLEDEDLGDLSLRDLGEVRTRRGGELVHAFELVARARA
jgi:class 3 adenylate cyclase